MLNHVMIGSNDIDRTKEFYDSVLGVWFCLLYTSDAADEVVPV